MKVSRLPLVLGLAFVSMLFFSSCNSGGAKKQDSAFNPYVTGFSKKNISVNSSIEVLLSNEVTGVELNSPIDKKLFKFTPHIEGEAYLTGPRSIEFRPKDRLKPGTEYTAHFEVGSILSEVPAKFKTFKFNFSTIQPRIAYSLEELKVSDSQESGIYVLGGNLTSTDFVTDEQAEACLEVKDGKGNKLAVEWEHTSNNRRHVFKIENIKSEAQAYEINLRFDGKSVGHKWNAERNVRVPGYNDFELLSTRVIASDEQPQIVCNFSTAIDGKQPLDGLITLEGCNRLRYKVELNVVYVYPPYKVSGIKTLTVHEGIRSVKGGALAQTYEETLAFETLKPNLRFVSKGNIMPASNGLHVPFQAVGLKAVTVKVIRLYESNVLQFLQVNQLNGTQELARAGRLVVLKNVPLENTEEDAIQQWSSYALDLSKLIEPEPGAIYRVEIDFNRSQAVYPCIEAGESDSDAPKEETFEEAEKKYDNPNSYDYEYYYDEDYESSYYNDPCKHSYYSGGKRKISRNILASDLGMIAKQGENSAMHVVVTDLVSAQPKGGATVEAYSYQQQLIGSATTDGDGVAQLNVKGVPYVLVAKKDKQRSYLRVDNSSALNLSSFDISGDVVQKGLKGFIYGERGVWRPGDTLFISFILEDRDKLLPENHPVNFELVNPLGQVVQRQTQVGNKHHFYTFTTQTTDDAPTGNWKVVAKVGGTSFSKNIKVETVKPNRLKVEFALNKGDLITDKRVEGTLNSRWLHGATAKNLEAKINMSASSGKTVFKGYEAYSFDVPFKQFEAEDREIFSGRLNESGAANINASYNPGKAAPGTIKLKFTSRVFEEGGDYSVNESAATMMPYKYYIGIKEPKGAGEDNMLETDKEQTYDLVVLDTEGNSADLGNIKVDIYKVSWSWWWNSQNGSTANYSQSQYRTLVKSQKVSTSGGKATFAFTAKHNEWGRYLITVTDMSGNGSQTGILSYIDWPSWGGRPRQGDATGATMLSITTDKRKYQVGEKAQLSIPSSAGARALVSVENGSKVLRTFWVDCNDKQTDITFDLTAEMLPNVYAHVSMVQPHAQTKNDLPIRLYGVVPILVEDSRTMLKPKIDMPSVLEPGKTFTVKVSEENKQEMTYTLAIVDEGLLDLTNFKTPSPWHTFFAREALGVRTWDLFDLVIGAFGGKIEQLFAIGGDDEASAEKQRTKVNRFKPVVKFLGPFTLSGRSNEHTITLPNYVGSVRAMVVAGNGSAYGSTEKAVPVRKPLMVMATLPRVLGPGEEVLLPVNIFAMENSIKKVDVALQASDIFEVEEVQKSITFSAPGDEVLTFKLKVKEQVGKGTVKIIATGGGEKAEYDVEIAVRNANPKMYRTTSAIVEAGKTWNGTYELPGMEGTNAAVLEVSSFPTLNLEERLGYLIGYPHGCIEQTTSKAFPQLYLSKVMDLSKEETSRTEENVKAALERLKQFITPEGGFGYWPGDRFPNLWGSSYAGHFIIEAEKLGYSLPYGMKRSWVKFQKKEANMWSKNSDKQGYYTYGQADFDQAYRLYTLALAKEEELGAMNRLKEQADLSIQARWCLAGAYAAIGQAEVAKKIISTTSKEIPQYRNGFSQSFGSQERDKAMIIETLTLLNMREDAFLLVQQISETLASERWLGTQTTAYCLMSLSKFASDEGDKTIKITYNDGGKQDLTSQRPIWKNKLTHIQHQGSVELKNNGSSLVFARVVAQGIPAAGQEVASEKGLKLSIKYTTADKSTLNPQNLEQGTDFIAVVTVYNDGSQGDYKNLILNQIFPSGWEIINTRMFEGFNVNESAYDYRDIRDDRVYTYFPLRAGKSATYVVRLNAAYRGRFYMPATSCEAMYDAGIAANNTGMWVEVE